MPVSQLHHRNLVAEKFRKGRIRNVGIAHHHAKADPLLIPPRQIERQFPVLAQLQFSRLPLHVFPVHPNVDLGSERYLHQLLERLSQGFSLLLRRAHFVAHIRNKPHSIIRDNLTRGSQRHDDIPAGIIIRGERALIKAVGNERPGAEVIVVKVMSWDVGKQGLAAGPQSSQAACCDAALQKRSALHFYPDLNRRSGRTSGLPKSASLQEHCLKLKPRPELHSAEVVGGRCYLA